MRFVILYNPVAGRGKSRLAACDVETALVKAGHVIDLLETRAGQDQPQLESGLEDAQGLVVVGGDGTIRQAARYAIEAETPVWMFPLGTENLFAREHGMTRSVDVLIRAVERYSVQAMDVGEVNGEVFLMMVSMGFDAEVVHDLVKYRTGAITHLSYLRPILSNWFRWKTNGVRVEVDGQEIELPDPGQIVVANARQYAFRFDPAPMASCMDGLLDVVFLPMKSRLQMIRMAVKCCRRKHLKLPGVVHQQGKVVRVIPELPGRFQIDGDAAIEISGCDESGCVRELEIRIRPGVLKVLMP